jgi:hypothetical protein
MLQRLGKYHILERLGHGAMGTVFKAHDPMLDRVVALKIISGDIEVTPALRARFLREAQASARLAHPNLITVHDMGEQDGHLYIVMECLDGVELKHLIAERRAIPIEDKLAMMVEICEGLDYAHRRGVIHRDIKPSNIFVLSDGHLKILDFGIARLVTAVSELTATGVVMGTFRYMSPEQARGSVDQRADIFSVGAVFYEWLTFGFAFPGLELITILEQIRSLNPPPVTQADPALPPELDAIIERCLRKNPDERYASMDQVCDDLKALRGRLADEADRLHAQVRVRWGSIRGLRRVLRDEIGMPVAADPPAEERVRIARMRQLDQEGEAELARLQATVDRAEAMRPDFERAKLRLAQGDLADAVKGLVRIVTEMPEHSRATALLEQAREAQARARNEAEVAATAARATKATITSPQYARADWERGLEREGRASEAFEQAEYAIALRLFREAEKDYERAASDASRLAAVLVEARVDLEHKDWPACLARIQEVLEVAPDDETARDLRVRAATGKAEAEAEAERRRQLTAQLVQEARVKLDERRFALCLELLKQAVSVPAPPEAVASIDSLRVSAETAWAAEEAVRRARQQAERARWDVAQGRDVAEAERAAEYAPALWEAATAQVAEAEGAFGRQAYANAARSFEGAAATYRRAVDAARQARQRERQAAEHARERMQDRREAAEPIAAAYAGDLWIEAERVAAEAQAALDRDDLEEARQGFEVAVRTYRRAEDGARQAQQAERDATERARAVMEECRRGAQTAGSPAYAQDAWEAAALVVSKALQAIGQGDYVDGRRLLEEAAEAYRAAEEAARATQHRERDSAERARDEMVQSQRAAEGSDALRYAKEQCDNADAKAAEAYRNLAQRRYPEARESFAAASLIYRDTDALARDAVQRERQAATLAKQETADSREAAQIAGSLQHAPDLWDMAERRASEGEAALSRAAYGDAKERFASAIDAYRAAAEAGRQATGREHQAAVQQRLEMERRRQHGIDRGVPEDAPELWSAAESKAAEGEAALGREAYVEAHDRFAAAVDAYRSAEETASATRRDDRDAAQQAWEDVGRTQARAEQAGAPNAATSLWQLAEEQARAAAAAFGNQEFRPALTLMREAIALYERAEQQGAEALAQVRGSSEEARSRARESRDRAASIGVERLAKPLWDEAVTLLASADAAFAREEYAEAAEAYDRGHVVLHRAEEAARSASAAHAAAQAEVSSARATVAEARRLAAEAQAEAYAIEHWSASERTEAQASAALAREDYGAAVRLLQEARRQYSRAAQAARVSIEVDARRTEAQVVEARLLLESGDIATSLLRLDEILARWPQHAGALHLRAQARERETRLREHTEAVDRPTMISAKAVGEPLGEADIDGRVEPGPADRTEATRIWPEPAPDRVGSGGSPITEARSVSRWRPSFLLRRAGQRAVAVGLLVLVLSAAIFTYRLLYPQVLPPQPPKDAGVSELSKQIERLRQAVALSKLKSETESARQWAPAQYEAAQSKVSEAEAAAGGLDFRRAEQAFREAVALYETAASEAPRAAASARDAELLEAAKNRMEEARRAAVLAAAPRLAADPWKKAEAAQRGGETALKERDPNRARSFFGKADSGFREAERAALERASDNEQKAIARLRAQLAEAERVRGQVKAARRQADESGAPRYAANTFASAQQREDAAEVRFAREDYGPAAIDFQIALQEYGKATQEATSERRRVAALEEERRERETKASEQARSRAVALRDSAINAESPRLAREPFEQGQSKQAEADALQAAQNAAGAAKAYAEAAGFYTDAIRRAQGARAAQAQAEAARTRMLGDKQKARQDAPAFQEALGQERQGGQAFDRLAFAEATKHFTAAAELFAKAVPEPPKAVPEPPRPEPPKTAESPKPTAADEVQIRTVLEAYADAFKNKDVEAVRKLHPRLQSDDLRRLRESFEQSREYRVQLKASSVEVKGDTAIVKGRHDDVVVSRAGRTFRNDSAFTFTMKRTGGNWTIESTK